MGEYGRRKLMKQDKNNEKQDQIGNKWENTND